MSFLLSCSFLPGDQQHAGAQGDVNVDLDVVNIQITVLIAVNGRRDLRQKLINVLCIDCNQLSEINC